MSESLTEQLARRTVTFLGKANISQRRLARFLKVEESGLSKFLHGHANLNPEATLQLVRLMNLNKTQLEAKFASPAPDTRVMHLRIGGINVGLSNDGWIAKEGGSDDPNDSTNITGTNAHPSRTVPDDEELEFLAGLAGLHQAIIDKINARQVAKAKPNASGSTEGIRRTDDNKRSRTPGPRPDRFSR